jgi:agmatinase
MMMSGSGKQRGFGAMAHGIISMLGSPHCPPDEVAASEAKVAFLGVPYEGANVCIGRPGSALGPQGLRIASQEYFSWSFEWDIDLREAYGLVDCGDTRIAVGNAVRTHENVQADVAKILQAGAIPISIGGDHSLPIPCARALSDFLGPEKRMGYLAIDAHMDAGYSVDGEKETNCSGVARASELPNVRPENVAIVGVRGSLNPREWLQLIRERGINMYPMREVKERGIEPALKDALDRVWDGTDGVYVTWDTDSVDAAHAPGTTEPEPGGLTSHEILTAARIIGERGFTALDNVELAPIYDISGITGKLVWCVLSEALYANARARA